MGITASILADRSGERLQKRSSHNVSNTWMDFSVTTNSHYKYHRVHVNLSMPLVESLLTRRISLIEIQVLPLQFAFLIYPLLSGLSLDE
jgi:hypothetical protein